MSFLQVDLGLESSTGYVDSNIDPVKAALELAAAQESLIIAEAEAALLKASMESLQRGKEFAAAIAEKSGDQQIAVAVGVESIKSSLRMIGQQHAAAALTTGVEDVTGIHEATENIISKAWEKLKEYAKKIWEFIKGIFKKAVDFVKGIFGKGGNVSASLIVKLEDLVKKGAKLKSNIKDEDKEKLAKHIKVAALVTGKTFGEEGFKEVFKAKLPFKVDNAGKIEFASNDIEGLEKAMIALVKDVKIDSMQNIIKNYVAKLAPTSTNISDKVIKLYDVSKGEDVASKFGIGKDGFKDGAYVADIIGTTGDQAFVVFYGVNQKAKEAISELQGASDPAKFIEKLPVIESGFTYKLEKVDGGKLKDSDYTNSVELLEADKLIGVLKVLNETEKKALPYIEANQKVVENVAASMEKLLEQKSNLVDKNGSLENDDNKKLQEAYEKMVKFANGFLGDYYKGKAKEAAELAKSITNSGFTKFIEENMKYLEA